MLIRSFNAGDQGELWELFFNTVRHVNIRDYSPSQVAAWAPENQDKAAWRQRIQSMNPIICEHQQKILGYAGLLPSGHIDHFYVHHQFQRQGIGSRIFASIEDVAKRLGLGELTSDVSISARPFFESKGFEVVDRQEVHLGEQALTNFRMRRRQC